MSSVWLSVAEVAEEIGMSADYVQRQCKSGAIKAKKLGSEWRISRAALNAFMGADGAAPAARPPRLSARQQRKAS